MKNRFIFFSSIKKFFCGHKVKGVVLLMSIAFSHSKISATESISSLVSSEEKACLKRFFRYLLIQEGGIYTLWGSKPVTVFTINLRTPQELQALYKASGIEPTIYLVDLSNDNDRLEYEKLSEEQKKRVLFVDNEDVEILSKWENWEKIREKFTIKKYLLFMKDNPHDKKAPFLFFVNIAQTITTLQDHYMLFKEVYEQDFDPLNSISELKNPHSTFWDKILEDHRTRGILFGYGKENALCFYWQSRDSIIKSPPKNAANKDIEFKIYQLEDLPIPGFVSFSENDPIVKKYHKEKKQIQKEYDQKDFVYHTLKKLLE